MIKNYSIYRLADGIFVSYFTGDKKFLPMNTPEGCGSVEGIYDHLSKCIDLETGDVIEYIPARPSENHEWDSSILRWVYVPTIADRKAKKLTEINDRCAALLSAVRDSYPPDEVQSWGKQETEAREYAADSTAAVPLLTALAEARGVPLDVLVSRVIEKADLFADISGRIIGKRQRCEDRINAAKSIEQVEAVTWPE